MSKNTHQRNSAHYARTTTKTTSKTLDWAEILSILCVDCWPSAENPLARLSSVRFSQCWFRLTFVVYCFPSSVWDKNSGHHFLVIVFFCVAHLHCCCCGRSPNRNTVCTSFHFIGSSDRRDMLVLVDGLCEVLSIMRCAVHILLLSLGVCVSVCVVNWILWSVRAYGFWI